MEEVKTAVNEINNNLKAHFGTKISIGKTKTPDQNSDKETEIDLQELTYTQMIMGSLAALIWGKAYIKNDNQINTLLGNKNTIFGLIEEIKNNAELFNVTQNSIIESNDNDNAIKVKVVNLKDLNTGNNIDIDNFANLNNTTKDLIENVKTYISKFDEFKTNLESINTATQNVATNITKFGEIFKEENLDILKNTFESINTFKSIFDDVKKDIEKLSKDTKKTIDIYFKLDDVKTIENLKENLKKFLNEDVVVFNDETNKNLQKVINILDQLDNIKNNPIWIVIDDEKLQEALDKFNDLKINIYNPNELPNLIKNLRQGVEKEFNLHPINIEFNIDDNIIDKLNRLNEAISNIDYSASVNNIKSIRELLDSLEYSTSYDSENIKTNLENLIKVFDDDDNLNNNLNELFKRIHAIFGGVDQLDKDLTGINSALNTVIKVITIDPKTIELKGLKTLIKITDPNDGLIDTLLNNLAELTNDPENGATIDNKKLNSIKEFFNAMAAIGNISKSQRNRIKSNIKYFNNFIGTDIPNLINELAKSSNSVLTLNNIHTFEALANIFVLLSKIGEISFKNKIRMKLNLLYIRHFILNDVLGILQEIFNKIKKKSPEAFKIIDQLSKLFDKIFEISNVSIMKFIKMSINFSLIEDIIREHIIGDNKTGILNAIIGIPEDDIKKAINNAEDLVDIFDEIGNIVNNDDFTLKNVVSFIIKLALFSTSRKLIDNFLSTIKSIIDTVNQMTDIKKDKKLNIESAIGLIERISNLDANILKVILLYPTLKITKSNVESIEDILITLDNIDIDANKIGNIIDIVSSLLKLRGSLIGSKTLSKSLNIIKNSTDKIKEICENIKNIDEKYDIEKTKKIIGTFNDIIIKAAAVLIIGGIVMRIINPVKLAMFAITLGGFLWGISKVLISLSKNLRKDIKIAKEAIYLVGVSGMILILGGLMMNIINPVKLFLFAATLGLFIVTIASAYLMFSLVDKEVLKEAKRLTLLIVVSAGTLMLGSLFMLSGLWKPAIRFAVLLAGFIVAMITIYGIAAKKIQKSLVIAAEFSLLIAVSAGVLMLGALFVSNPKRILNALFFGVVLGLFVFGIISILRIASTNMRKAMSTMVAISLLIAVAAYTLIIGGTLFALFPGLAKGVLTFGLILLGFIATISFVCLLLNLLKKWIRPGLLVFAGILIILALSAIAVTMVALTSLLIAKIGYDKIFLGLATIAAIIIVTTGICALLGMPEVAGFVLLGIVVLALMNVMFILMSIAVASFIAVLKYASTLDETTIDNAYDALGAAIWGLVKLTPAFLALSAASVFMVGGIAALFVLSAALAVLAKTIKMWSELKIPEYDHNGKICGYKTLDKTDFTRAIGNIGTVLTTLSEALITIYEKDKSGIFGIGGFSGLGTFLLTGKSPAQRVISGLMQMSKMLASIATGVKAWAKLRIPEYDNKGKISGYITIGKTEFTSAGENIKNVVVTLAEAILDIYKTAPEGMFESKEWLGLGNTPFAKVTKALKTMGPMLSSIANGVKTWSKLEIPVYGKGENANKIVNHYQLGSTEFGKAKNNIIEVVKCLAEGVLEVYYLNPDMFDDDSWHGFGDTPFALVTKSMKSMGDALENIADAVKLWAELKIPVYGDPNDLTKVTSYKTIDNDVFKEVGKNIGYVVTSLAKAVASLADDPTYGELFTEKDLWLWGDTKVAKVLQSIKPLGSALSDIADAIKAWASMNIPVYGDPKNLTKITEYKQLTSTDITNAKTKIGEVIPALFDGVKLAYENNKPYFKDDSILLGLIKTDDSPIAKVIKSVQPLGKALKSIADAIKLWSELKIPIYANKNSIEPTGYMSIGGETGITTAIDNIKKVLRATVSAVASVYYGNKYKDLFDDDNEIIKNVTSSMSKMSNMISSMAKGIQSIAELKIPVYNAKGEIIKYNNIESGHFGQIEVVIKNVLTALGRAIIDVATDPKLDIRNNPNFSTAIDAIKSATDILSSIASVVANYATGKFQLYELKDNKLVPTATVDINNTQTKENIQKNIVAMFEVIESAIDVALNSEKISKYANIEGCTTIIYTKKSIILLIEAISEIYKTIAELQNIINSNKEHIEEFIKHDDKDTEKYAIANNLEKVIDSFDQIVIKLKSNELRMHMNTLSNNKDEMIKNIKASYDVLYQLLVKVSQIANNNYKLKNVSFDNITGAIDKYASSIEAINEKVKKAANTRLGNGITNVIYQAKKINEMLNEFITIIKTSKSINNDTYSSLNNGIISIYLEILKIKDTNEENFRLYNSLIQLFINTVKSAGELDFDNKANSLRDGILNIYSVIKEINDTKKFKEHIKDLEKYIKTINSIDLSKLSGIQSLVDALNKISEKFGNLDELTEAISTNLTSVLNELVAQLNLAKESINDAHALQEARKKLINESIEKVKDIMSNPMVIEITQGGEENNSWDDEGPIIPSKASTPPAAPPKGNEGENNGGSILTDIAEWGSNAWDKGVDAASDAVNDFSDWVRRKITEDDDDKKDQKQQPPKGTQAKTASTKGQQSTPKKPATSQSANPKSLSQSDILLKSMDERLDNVTRMVKDMHEKTIYT